MSEVEIDIRQLSYRFDANRALGPVNVQIRRGERVAALGASGVGKSTLLALVAGLKSPTSGEIFIGGAPVRGPSARATLMLQRPALLPWASVSENVALGLRFNGLARSEPQRAQARVADLLAAVGLADRADALPHELSGGQQQRVALARALAPQPEVLLLDEPFSALDIPTREALRADVSRIAQKQGATLVLVTHDIADAVALCDRAIVLGGNPGRVTADMGVGDEGVEYLTEALRAA
ncbi:MAG: ABC transporter ATP-binding protein [Hyphomicrobiales bacterium]|nr:ABC transporter ATP-binding protein [Hyphomicrobiales bacterium]